jgi:hypothetical protein
MAMEAEPSSMTTMTSPMRSSSMLLLGWEE